MTQGPQILVTGGTGYIGSHICVALAAAGYCPVIVDDLSNAHASVIDRLEALIGFKPAFYQYDVRDEAAMYKMMADHDVQGVIHLAAKKSVEESVRDPLGYYKNNIDGLLSLLAVMDKASIKNLVYSSSATVYAPTGQEFYAETDALGPVNPYGWTKYMGEQIVKDVAAMGQVTSGILRYFNPVGAHESGRIGEDPKGVPNNLMPLIMQVARGKRDHIVVHGQNYDTPDKTAVRDYIHVMDVAEAHVKVLKHIDTTRQNILLNIGSGKGYSVLDLLTTYEQVNGINIPHKMGPRRAGDVGHICADTRLAQSVIGWKARKNLEDMCRDAHRWVITNKS